MSSRQVFILAASRLSACLLAVGIIVALPGILWAAEGLASEANQQTAEVQSLLRLRCVKCHNPLHPEAELNLSTLRGLARGGENGPAVVLADPLKSHLWQRVSADEMPPNAPLPASEKQLLQNWLESGSPGLPAPGHNLQIVGLDHWAFQHLAKLDVPTVKVPDGLRTPIDHFLQAQLDKAGLTLNAAADRVTLIRRVAFTLTGLPPTPEEIAAFESDAAEDAYEQMVERYLASPRYGEHWGQFWLDAAGYADSSGYFSNERDRPLAWRYRDYVIDAFNRDKPLEQFICEQLAGDELFPFQPGQEVTPDQLQSLIATQFLANAPDGTDQSAASPEAQQVDRYAALEGTQEMIASNLLGLTVKCARCHDHKFEPISQREYYQLQSILLPALNPRDWVPPLQRKLRVSTVDEQNFRQQQNAAFDRQLAELERERKGLEDLVLSSRQRGTELFFDGFSHTEATPLANWRLIDTQKEIPFPIAGSAAVSTAQVKDGALHVISAQNRYWVISKQSFDWTPAEESEWIQFSFRLVADRLLPSATQAMRVGYYLALIPPPKQNAGQGGLLVDGNPTGETGIYLDPPAGPSQRLSTIAKEPYQPGTNYGVRITKLAGDQYRVEHLINFRLQPESIVVSAANLPDGAFGYYAGHGRSFIVDDLLVEGGKGTPATFELTAEQVASEKRLNEIQASIRQLEAQRQVDVGNEITWVSDRSAQAPEVFLLQRGNYNAPAEAVVPAGLQVLSDAEHPFELTTNSTAGRTTGRRLAFARWLTKPGTRPAALVARVQANRIWLQHFGRGLTSTSENFGLSGEPPQQVALLDYLAAKLSTLGWKAIHREILLSAAFRQSSTATRLAMEKDPGNRLYSRASLRRLSAEQMRDAMLAVSGELDLTAGGPAVPIEQTGTEQEKARGPLNREVVVSESTSGAHRRSIYLQHKRTQIPTVLALFGSPSIAINCVERRPATVPLQSLSQLNSEFIRLRAKAMAQRVMRESGGEEALAIRRATVLTAGRSPSAAEEQLAHEFVAQQRSLYATAEDNGNKQAWTDLCHMLLASNLFLYIE